MSSGVLQEQYCYDEIKFGPYNDKVRNKKNNISSDGNIHIAAPKIISNGAQVSNIGPFCQNKITAMGDTIFIMSSVWQNNKQLILDTSYFLWFEIA